MMTRLDNFLRTHKVKPAQLAQSCGVARQSIFRLRHGEGNPTLTAMRTIRDGCRRVTGLPVKVTDIFDFGDGE